MLKAKKEVERLKQKLASSEAPMLSWEAKRLLQLYAQGLSDWQQDECRKPWKVNYREALRDYGSKFNSAEGLSSSDIYFLLFMTSFRGGKDSEKAEESVNEFWLLARKVAPQAVEQLLSTTEEKRLFLKKLNEVSAETV
jgi:hypothetical protein